MTLLDASALTVWLFAATIFHLAFSDYIVLIGAVGFALSTLRTGRMRILHATNLDLVERNKMLEADRVVSKAKIAALENRPDLDKHADLLGNMIRSLEKHDERMTMVTYEILKELRSVPETS